jgi:hypothetical protein
MIAHNHVIPAEAGIPGRYEHRRPFLVGAPACAGATEKR